MIDPKNASVSVLLTSMFLAIFVAFNDQTPEVAISAIAYAVISGLMAVFISSGSIIPNFNLVGPLFGPGMIKGVILGALFMTLKTAGLTIGAPQEFLSLGVAGLFIMVVIVTPIAEEFLFRGLLLPLLEGATGTVRAILIQAGIFSLYHFAAYGGFLGLTKANPGLFIGAFLFGIAAAVVLIIGPNADRDLEGSIIGHMIFNFFLLNSTSAFLAIG